MSFNCQRFHDIFYCLDCQSVKYNINVSVKVNCCCQKATDHSKQTDQETLLQAHVICIDRSFCTAGRRRLGFIQGEYDQSETY